MHPIYTRMHPLQYHGGTVVPVTADQDWTQTPDRNVWRALRRGRVLTVTRTAVDRWVATVEGRDISERSPALTTRLAAQRWAESQALAPTGARDPEETGP